MRKIGLAACAMAITACGGSDLARMEDVHDMMSNVMEPAAEGIWDRAGWDITAEGEVELWPTTDAGWQEVVASADKLIAAAQQLQQPPYTTSKGDWNEISDGLIVAASRARKAAEDQDKEELFDAGGHIYRVCVSCHQIYIEDDAEGAGG